MSPMLQRILLALALLVGAMAVRDELYGITGTYDAEDWPDLQWILSNLAGGLFLMIGWVLIWRRAVIWSLGRILGTAGLAVGVILLSAGIGLAHGYVENSGYLNWDPPAMCGIAVWIAGTALLWRRPRDELPAPGSLRVVCLKCGYDLRGLHEARCPECGTQYTLDRLLGENHAAATEFGSIAADHKRENAA